MKNFCECGIHYEIFDEVICFFMKKYIEFLKVKSKDIKTKTKYNKLETQYKTLVETIESLREKGRNCISLLEQCNNNHKEKINDINSNIEKIDILSERFEDHHKMLLENIPKELDDNPEEEEEEEKKEININNDEEDDYKKIDIRKTKEDLIIIENLLENPEFQAKNEEDKRELLKLMNQIKEARSNMEVKLNR